MAHISNLEQAVALDMEKWLQTLPEEAPEYKFSEKYNKFRVKLFDKMRGEKYHRFTKRATVAIIVAAILFAMAVATLAATVGKDFILKHFNGYAEVEVSDVENADYVNDFQVNYIPDGFIKTDEDKSIMGITYSFKKDDEWFDISKRTIDTSSNFDEENGSISEQIIDGKQYLIKPQNISNSIIWNDGKYAYEINGTLPKEELLKIAQGAR